MTILFLTREFDPTSDHVIEELNRRGALVLRVDIADFPLNIEFTAMLGDSAWAGALRVRERFADMSKVTGIYYRRPTGFRFPAGMSGPHREWAESEARLGFLGTLAAVPRWLNHPTRIAAAEYKPVQLRHAREVGLRAPRTIVTNIGADAKVFAESIGGEVIYKPFSPRGVIAEDGRQDLLFATRVQPNELDDPALGLTAHLVQEFIEHDHAVRLTVVDRDIFAASIHAGSDAAVVDWRSDYDALRYERITPPAEVRDAVLTLMAWFGLRFGAFDFLVTAGGEWVFLELNPNGQWAWIPQVAAEIAAALATALQKGPPGD